MPSSGLGRTPNRLTAAGKRLLDVVLGSVLAVLALPLIALIAIGLLVSLRANPFFVQRRPGRDGRTFRIIKLRTLPPSTPHYASKHELKIEDMGLPWLCELLRRTHLDELPQLFLVPLGSMSLVGPRPRLPDTVEAVDFHFDSLRRAVRPGCTGLWQISSAADDVATGAPRFDLFYLRHASVRFDVWIMLRTIGTVLRFGRPIEVDDVPAWIRGHGLVDAAAFVFPVAAVDEALEAELEGAPAVYASDPAVSSPAPIPQRVIQEEPAMRKHGPAAPVEV